MSLLFLVAVGPCVLSLRLPPSTLAPSPPGVPQTAALKLMKKMLLLAVIQDLFSQPGGVTFEVPFSKKDATSRRFYTVADRKSVRFRAGMQEIASAAGYADVTALERDAMLLLDTVQATYVSGHAYSRNAACLKPAWVALLAAGQRDWDAVMRLHESAKD